VSPERGGQAGGPVAVLPASGRILGPAGGAVYTRAIQVRPLLALIGSAVLVLLTAGVARTNASEPRFAVGLRIVRLVDTSRSIRLPDGTRVPRTLVTLIRYPAVGAPGSSDVRGAPPARADGPFPLVVFGHGYAVTPSIYARLLRAWTRAGYVVAAPIFPLENEHAPGGPNESDLVNQPADVRFVITQLLAANATPSSPLDGMIDATRIAVAGQSDGAETAFAVAYDRPFRDARIRAAVILSGAQLSGARFAFPKRSPPLLATQGSADTINPPALTDAFYAPAPRPKFLLTLLGAAHLGPYADEQPQLGIVERVTIAFLDRYLKQGSLHGLIAAGTAPGFARLAAAP